MKTAIVNVLRIESVLVTVPDTVPVLRSRDSKTCIEMMVRRQRLIEGLLEHDCPTSHSMHSLDRTC